MTDKEIKHDEDGKMINPHNPDFITKVPWYVNNNNNAPTLKHHNIQSNDYYLNINDTDNIIKSKIELQKQQQVNKKAKGFRKGACKNCGAMTHTEKDCLERPRSSTKTAKYNNITIANDDVIINLEGHGKLNYDSKRDQYKGYDAAQYNEVIEKYNRIENEKMKMIKETINNKEKEKKQKEKVAKKKKKGGDGSDSNMSDSDTDYDTDDNSDDDGILEGKEYLARDDQAGDFQGAFAPQGGLGGAGMRSTVRNLRIREDTPKYLRNLDLDSAFYDPKSRAMRANPLPDENPEDLQFAGDNFVRYSGDAVKLAQNQVLCWEMQDRGESIDVISNPSQAELLQKQFIEKKKELVSEKKKAIIDKYLDGKSNKQLDPRLRLGQTEAYVEYSRDGRVLTKGVPVVKKRTKYEEDVFINNHTSVWGSYYNRAQASWGYACCHSLMKNSYCTGEKGKIANDAADNEIIDSNKARKMLESKPLSDRSDSKALNMRSDLFGDGGTETAYDPEKIKAAKEKASQSESNSNSKSTSGKRGYNSMESVEVTAEDMEVYRMKRSKADDPMAALLGSEEVLEYK